MSNTNEKQEKKEILPSYIAPAIDTDWKFACLLQDLFWRFVKDIPEKIRRKDLKFEKYIVETMGEICVRVDKRAVYFDIFHDVEMSEIRRAALIAYWILKFHPIRLDNDAIIKDVNSRFAVYIVLCAVQEYARVVLEDNSYLITLSEAYMIKLKYAFKYWDLSKEAIMLIAETIAEHVITNKK